MVTIKDIAREAGVSFTTVSNVIHGNVQHVSAATVQRVQRVMEQLQYVPNMRARGLVSSSSHLLAFAYGHDDTAARTVLEDPFASTVVGAVEQEVRARSYFLLFSGVQSSGNLVQTVDSWNVDGVLVFGLSAQSAAELRQGVHCPLVFIDGCFPQDGGKYVNVGIEDRAAARRLTEYLLARGHRKIGLCSACAPENRTGADRERMLGWQDALRGVGILPPADWVLPCATEQDCANILERLHDFTALFVCSDLLAARLQLYLQDRGVRVPRDISIVGFDGNEYADMARPRITTMRQDVHEKGRRAVQQLLEYIETGHVQQPDVQLKCTLIEQDSVRNLNE